MQTDKDSVGEIILKAENDYTQGTTSIGKYVDWSMHETIERIYAYLNSKHITGEKDSMGRDKPFFNIIKAARNIWYRATDIDRKHIMIKPSEKAQRMMAFLATIHLGLWMKKEKFGTWLNEWGLTLADFGSAVTKLVESDGRLIPSVVPWNRIICDPVDFENNPVIEVLWVTPAQLKQNKNYDQEMVDSLLDNKESRQTLSGQTKDNRADYIKIYEIHGELPLAYLTDDWENDHETFQQQMHIIAFSGKRKESKKADEYTLYKGRESKSPYKITHLLKIDGRSLSVGAVEDLFETQWMMNHTAKQIKDQLDLASKLIFQTSDGNYAGRNVLTSIENGDILIYNAEQPLTQLANNSHDITSIQNFAAQWQNLAKEITSTPDSIAGNTMPSGTAYRQVAILNQESHSLFEQMLETKGLYLEDILREYIIPFLKKQMDTTEEIVATLDDQGITQFDSMFVPNEARKIANNRIKAQVLSGQIANDIDVQSIELGIKQGLSTLGNERYIKPSEIPSKTWKDIFKDFEWKVDVEITDESTNKEVVLSTLSTVLQSIVSNPLILQDPNAKMVFNQILDETGRFSPIQLQQASPQQPTQVPTQAQPLNFNQK